LRNETKQKIAWQSGEDDTGRSKVAHTTLTYKKHRVGGVEWVVFYQAMKSKCQYAFINSIIIVIASMGEGQKCKEKRLFWLPWQSAKKKPTNTKKMFAFVVLLNNLHKCAGESFKGLTTAKANRVVLYKIFWGIYGTKFLTGGS